MPQKIELADNPILILLGSSEQPLVLWPPSVHAGSFATTVCANAEMNSNVSSPYALRKKRSYVIARKPERAFVDPYVRPIQRLVV
jgi:hypothetical protein